MGKLVHRHEEYMVIEDNYKLGHHIIINTKGEYKHHAHIKYLGTCKKLLNWMDRNIVPHSPYLRGAVLRISLDKDYIIKVKNKIEKDKNKQRYFNPSKGVVRK